MSFTLHTPELDLPPHGARTPDTILFGDETFLISVFSPRFCVVLRWERANIHGENRLQGKPQEQHRETVAYQREQKNTSFDD